MPEAGGARSVLDRLSRDPDAGVRRTAVRHLAGVAEPGLIPVLAAALEDDDYRITAMAAEGLAHIGVPAADALLAASASDKENVRSYAAGAMAQTDTPAVRARLRALLDDGGARGQAARSLGALKDRDAVPALIRILEEDTDVPQAQHLAAGALGSIGDARAVPALLGLLDGRDWPADYASWAADWAAGALIKIGDTSAIPGARGVFRDEERASRVRQAALRVLVALDDRAIAGEVAHLAVGGGWEWAASDALKRIGDAPAIRQLVAALGSEDSEQRRRAVLVLSRLTDDDGLAEARAWVAEAGAVPALRRLAEDPNVATSGPAQGVLARVER